VHDRFVFRLGFLFRNFIRIIHPLRNRFAAGNVFADGLRELLNACAGRVERISQGSAWAGRNGLPSLSSSGPKLTCFQETNRAVVLFLTVDTRRSDLCNFDRSALKRTRLGRNAGHQLSRVQAQPLVDSHLRLSLRVAFSTPTNLLSMFWYGLLAFGAFGTLGNLGAFGTFGACGTRGSLTPGKLVDDGPKFVGVFASRIPPAILSRSSREK